MRRTGCIVRYAEVEENGVYILRKEEYPSKFSGRLNYWMARHNPNKRNVTIEYIERKR